MTMRPNTIAFKDLEQIARDCGYDLVLGLICWNDWNGHTSLQPMIQWGSNPVGRLASDGYLPRKEALQWLQDRVIAITGPAEFEDIEECLLEIIRQNHKLPLSELIDWLLEMADCAIDATRWRVFGDWLQDRDCHESFAGAIKMAESIEKYGFDGLIRSKRKEKLVGKTVRARHGPIRIRYPERTPSELAREIVEQHEAGGITTVPNNGGWTFTLPEAQPGMQFTFHHADERGVVQIDPPLNNRALIVGYHYSLPDGQRSHSVELMGIDPVNQTVALRSDGNGELFGLSLAEFYNLLGWQSHQDVLTPGLVQGVRERLRSPEAEGLFTRMGRIIAEGNALVNAQNVDPQLPNYVPEGDIQ